MILLELPYPPSVNRYYRNVRGRTLISRDGREYRKQIGEFVAGEQKSPLDGPLSVMVDLHPPDRRRRDVDNTLKALLDSLEHAGVYRDDSQIVHLQVRRLKPVDGGQTVVSIMSYSDYQSDPRAHLGPVETVCCARCGRDAFRRTRDVSDAYCDRCLAPGRSHVVPDDLDRDPFRFDDELDDECDEDVDFDDEEFDSEDDGEDSEDQ